jgi:hypothetical protein
MACQNLAVRSGQSIARGVPSRQPWFQHLKGYGLGSAAGLIKILVLFINHFPSFDLIGMVGNS